MTRTPQYNVERSPKFRRGLAVFVAVAALVMALALTMNSRRGSVGYLSEPIAVMGTTARVSLVAGRDVSPSKVFDDAVGELRRVEALMSAHLDASELSRLNAAPAGPDVPLSDELLALLKLSRTLAAQSGGAFDVTCLPIIRAWKDAASAGRIPTGAEIAAALDATGWGRFELGDAGARKSADAAGIDLGGIAKGYGIDLAAERLIASGASGGLVDVGGDIRCFGRREDGGNWQIGIQSPFDPGEPELIATLTVADEAVCTSGNYRRFSEIGGKRYSHIVDPRTGLPADVTPSVTVIAPTATVADAWATALSVLGADGLKLLPAESHVEAALVLGGPGDFEFVTTPGFSRRFSEAPDHPVREAATAAHAGPAGRGD
jgi:thiamine biosynthesis lipoprotein